MRYQLFRRALGLILLLLLVIGQLPGQSRPSSDSLAELAKQTRYLALIDSSFSAGGRGDYALASQQLRQALQLYPRTAMTPMLLNNLGGLQQLQGDTTAALLSYTAALEQDPQEATTRFNRAKLFVRMHRTKAALTDFALLIAQEPRNELYRYQRAMLYLLEQDYTAAELDLKHIIEQNEASLKARIGYALLETMRGRYAEAERLYAFLVDKLPRNAEVYEGRARMYLARGMRGFAQRDLNLALEYAAAQPTSTLYRLRAELAQAEGNMRLVAESIRRAEELERSGR